MTIPLIMAITGILLLLNPNTEPMTREQQVMQGAYLTLHTIDWRQTRTIAKNPDEFHEHNIVLGSHPTVDEVDKYMIASALLHAGVTKSLSSKHRNKWIMFTMGIETGYVVNNYKLGIRMDF